MIKRSDLKAEIVKSLLEYPVTVLSGPRQCGKTTIAKVIAGEITAHFFDVEDPKTPLKEEHASLVLEPLEGNVIIDEVQRQPSLFNLLRVLSDRLKSQTKFLILGSASPNIIKNFSESLAGRANFIDMEGFDMLETKNHNMETLWLQGGYPLSFLALSQQKSMRWRENFIRTFLICLVTAFVCIHCGYLPRANHQNISVTINYVSLNPHSVV